MGVGDESDCASSGSFQVRCTLLDNPDGQSMAFSNQCFPNMRIGEFFHPGKCVPADDNGATVPGSSRFKDLPHHIGFMNGDRTGGGDVGGRYPAFLQFRTQAVERWLCPLRNFLNPPSLNLFQLHTQPVFGFRVFGTAEFQKFWRNRGQYVSVEVQRPYGARLRGDPVCSPELVTSSTHHHQGGSRPSARTRTQMQSALRGDESP